MPAIASSGVLPGIILENTRPGGWVGTLRLTGDLDQLARLELVGAGASYFQTSLNPATGLVTVSPGASIDYEALMAAGLSPDLVFTFRYTFADGSVQDDPTPRTVTVQDLDDTPPQGLRFISGGAVNAGDIGAVIGTLQVTDPDTPNGPFYFSFAPEYDWMLQLDGNVLRLRDGISLQLDLIGTWSIYTLVSDGTNAAAFALSVTVNPPGTEQGFITFVKPGDVLGGVACTAAGTLTTALSLTTAAAFAGYGGNVWQLVLQDGTALWLDSLVSMAFADGTLTAGPAGLSLRYVPAAGLRLRASNITALDGSSGADRYDFSLLPTSGPTVQLAGMAGNDTLTGNGSFNVQASYDASPAAVLVDLAAGTAQDGWGGTDTLVNIRRVSATSGFNDTLRGSGGTDLFIIGNQGTKLLDGRGGTDWVRLATTVAATLSLGQVKDGNGAWLGSASFASGGGAATLLGLRNAVGGTGSDSIAGNADDNVLVGDAGSNTLTGGGGYDTVSYDPTPYGGSAAPRGVTVNLAARNVLVTNPWGGTDRLVGITSVWGTPYADRLTGVSTAGYSYLVGGAGNDTLVAPAGSSNVVADYSRDPASAQINLLLQIAIHGWGNTDTLSNIAMVRGTPYADTIWAGAAACTIWGGGGRDVVVLGTAPAVVNLGAEDCVVYIGGANQVINAPASNNVTLYTSITLTLPAGFKLLYLQEGAGNINGTGNAGPHVIRGNSGNNLITGGSGPNTLYGGGGDDTLIGSDQTAAMYGEAGNDSLVAGNGTTLLDGGPGNDTLVAGRATTLLEGGDGNDSLIGSAVPGQTLSGGAGNDTLTGGTLMFGGDGNDYLASPRGKASLYGGNGDDVLVANNQGDYLDGGPGADTIYAGTGRDTIDTGTGIGDWVILGTGPTQLLIRGNNTVVVAPANNNATITLYAGWWMGANIKAATMAPGAGNLWAVGSNVDCTITGNEGANVLHPGSANCTLLGMDGNDLIYAGPRTTLAMGGDGNDWIVGGSGNGTLDGGAGNDNISAGSGRYLILGGDGNDWLVGGSQDCTLDGGAGNDTILGGDGNELLLGGPGWNWISCGNGNDTVEPGPDGSWIFAGGSGRKLVYAHSQWDVTFVRPGEDVTVIADCNYALWPNTPTLILAPGAGDLIGRGSNIASLVVGNEGNNVLIAGTGPATLQGGLGNDTLYGGPGGGLLQGGEGNDWLSGGSGPTTLDGGAGNDVLGAGSGATLLLGGDGNDWMLGGSGACTLDGGAGDDWLGGGSGPCTLLGGEGNDTLVAGSGGSLIDPGGGRNWITVINGTAEITLRNALDVVDVRATAGSVTVTSWVSWTMAPNVARLVLAEGAGDLAATGNAGSVAILGNSGNNRLVAGAGSCTLDGGAGDDTLQGGPGNSLLQGGAGDDLIISWIGDDTLAGGPGSDTLVGGQGADCFLYNAGDGADVVVNFYPARDQLRLVGLGLTGLEELLALAVANGDDTLLDFGNGDSLLLRGVALSALGAGNVWLV